jgi:aminoglycoside 2''-adenylyltransferase
MNDRHIDIIHSVMNDAEKIGMPIWLESGWAVDARLGRVTRKHDDIDLAFPAQQGDLFKQLLQSYGCSNFEYTDYGFLVNVKDVLLDCEPCFLIEGTYEIEDMPSNSFPIEKEGNLKGLPVRCTSWEAIIWEYFGYQQEVDPAQWPKKDIKNFEFICSLFDDKYILDLRSRFAESHSGMS